MPITSSTKVSKRILKNGLTVLVRQNHLIPKVSIQLWYNVGSKDEKTGQKGIAHLIEHMIFKGTEKLSESDINLITYKLSGYTNAFTSFDYTGYLFDLPTHHWYEALPIMADCMQNCTFKQALLNSELKAVIQELKMYKDDYGSALIEQMISGIFFDHPYHYPIIGFKHDLWKLKREELLAFYKNHYVPNNAVLVVVGDVEIEDVYQKAEHYFGSLEPNPEYQKEKFYHHKDLLTQSVSLYRDIQQPIFLYSFEIPGAHARLDYVVDVLSWIIGHGKGSRLQKILVDELELATEVEAFSYDLFDYGIFFIYVQPKDLTNSDAIAKIIAAELESLTKNGASASELERATKKSQVAHLSVLENNQKQAYSIGQSYLATGDENALFNYANYSIEELREQIKLLLNDYFRPSSMHTGRVLPIAQHDKEYWHNLQHISDSEDNKILGTITRDVIVEEGKYVSNIKIQKAKDFHFPKPEKFYLSNGLKVLYYNNPNVAAIDIILSFKAKHYFDPENQQGLISFMSSLLVEGTKKHNAVDLAQAIELKGMGLNTTAGYITMNMLSDDLEYGLSLLSEILKESTFEQQAVEKVRSQFIADLYSYWDAPSEFVGQLARQAIYKDHPYHKNPLGTLETIKKFTRDDLLKAYKEFISPHEATIAIAGNLASYDIKGIIEKTLGSWQGPHVKDITFSPLEPLATHTVDYPIARDQIVLAFAGQSISRGDPLFDSALLFDQIFTGGTLGTMSSRLFQLREQTGLFYTIGGSLLYHSDEQPGMLFIKTLVSKDRLEEAESVIDNTINSAADILTDEEVSQAKNAIINSYIDNFESNKNIAMTFLLLDRFKLPDNYFDHRAQQLEKINLNNVRQTAHALLNKPRIKLRVGRL